MNLVSLENRQTEVFNLLKEVFSPLITINDQILIHDIETSSYIFSKGIESNGTLVGVYLLRPHNHASIKNLNLGIEGVALAVKAEFRNQGIGKKLINYSQTLPFDYIWGLAAVDLNNLNHWLKRRRVVGCMNNSYLTVQELNNAEKV